MAEFDIRAAQAEAKAKNWDDRTLAQRAADVAQELLPATLRALRADERPLLSTMAKLVGEAKYRRFLSRLCKEILQTPDRGTQADLLRALVAEVGGVPPIFSTMDRFRLKAAAMAARGLLGSALKADIRRVFRSTFGGLGLPTRLDKVNRCVAAMQKDGMQLLLSPLTPDVFGHRGAEAYLQHLTSIVSKQPGIGLSVQPWRLVPTLNPCAPSLGAKALAEKLRVVLRLCTKGGSARPLIIEAGTSETLSIIIEAFKTALSGEEFNRADVALELPAYLKDSMAVLRDLSTWAEKRVDKGALPFKVLIVKGSRLDEETPLAYIYGERHAAFHSKAETETRFKQLVHTAIGARGIRPVIGTHNIFDIAYAMLDWGRSGRDGQPGFAFLMGLGNHLGRLLAQAGSTVWLTAPVAAEEGCDGVFETYLLDLVHELSRPDGYLCAGYAPESTSPAWSRMRQQFLAALSGRGDAPDKTEEAKGFHPGTLSRLLDRSYVDNFYAAAATEQERAQELIPLTIGGQVQDSPLRCIHRSLTAPGQVDYRFVSADYTAVDIALQRAADAAKRTAYSGQERIGHIEALARLLEKRRTKLMAVLVRDAGFTLADAEAEIRDAVDACHYYRHSVQQDGMSDGTQGTPLGVVVVAPNRTHPLADAVAGIAAAWLMGNTIVYKPAAYTTLLGCRLTEILTECGLKDPHLQYLPALDNQIALRLMTDSRVGGVIHPDEPQNAAAIAARSEAHLMSQPCGMSSVYISASGDWTAAVRDISKTAFRRSGQSADCPHLLLVQSGVYDNPRFLAALKDAVSCLRAEPGWREGADVGPLSYLLEESCWHMLTDADDEESWLVQPLTRENGSLIWTPGVRTGVKPGSRFLRHAPNLPLLGLMRVDDVEEATDLQALLSAGLSAGIYSTDAEEIDHWKQGVRCSDICINCRPAARPGTHPLGCWSPSLLGTTPLPGGPHFLTALCDWTETARPQRRGRQRHLPFSPWEILGTTQEATMRLTAAADSLCYWWENEFGTTRTIGGHPTCPTTLRYLPVPVCLRVEPTMEDTDLTIAMMAALRAGGKLQISLDKPRAWMEKLPSLPGVSFHEESRQEFLTRFPDFAKAGYRVRDLAATPGTRAKAAECRVPLCTAPILANGRLELLHYVQERTETRQAGFHG